ncbi:hypothetical protein [Rugamonas sp. DEMB1]|uniref:hypothetical protein n=1 Tax=Rugamonas sp. DEMB1 TaxID=3039386 RepID=UPI0024495D03|nr:hypothetical protein [Rugamonas sp. DEMB1]WGG48888.1 hypothetical protein QC826_19860 [Rugamonas sp. DEMB1]
MTSGLQREAFETPLRRLSGTHSSVQPPKDASASTWLPIQSCYCSLLVASM